MTCINDTIIVKTGCFLVATLLKTNVNCLSKVALTSFCVTFSMRGFCLGVSVNKPVHVFEATQRLSVFLWYENCYRKIVIG